MGKILFIVAILLAVSVFGSKDNLTSVPVEKIDPYVFFCLTGQDWSSDLEPGRLEVMINNSTTVHPDRKTAQRDDGSIGYYRVKRNVDYPCGYFFYSIYMKLAEPGYFIVRCTENGGGSLDFVNFMLVKKHRKYYYNKGAVKLIDAVLCVANSGKKPICKSSAGKILKTVKKEPNPAANAFSLQEIHPYAFFLLTKQGNSDSNNLLSVNASKFRVQKNVNENFETKPYVSGNRYGFTFVETPAPEEGSRNRHFYFSVYKKLKVPGYYIIQCVLERPGLSFTEYLLIKKHCTYYFDHGKFKLLHVLTRAGEFGSDPPSDREAEKAERLFKQNHIRL
jgi:hypothetical protein